MLRLQVYRLTSLLFFLFVLVASADAETWQLVQGGQERGPVRVRISSFGTQVPLDEALKYLGYSPISTEKELVAKQGKKKLELWHQSTVARVAGVPVTFPSPILLEEGHWWGEPTATLRLLERFIALGGKRSTLSWKQVPASPIVAPSGALSADPKEPPIRTAPKAEKSSACLIQEIRWGGQPGADRLVVELTSGVEPQIQRTSGKLVLTFSETALASTLQQKMSAKPASIEMQIASSGGKIVMTISHSAAAVKYFSLSRPNRFVVDFVTNAGEKSVSSPKEPLIAPIKTTQSTDEKTEPEKTIVKPNPAKGRPLVVIDAGHGGHDPGAVGNGLREKDVNLKAAHQLMAQLQSRGVEVRLTRKDDTYLKLAERTALANNWNADLFVSLHCNALPAGRQARGVEIYFMSTPSDKDAMNLAVFENKELSGNAGTDGAAAGAADKKTRLLLQILGDMQQNDKINESTIASEMLYKKIKGSNLNMRRVAQAPFFVLRGAGMPAMLVEMGFLTEKSDAALLNSAAYRDKLSASMAQGIVEYLNQYRREGM